MHLKERAWQERRKKGNGEEERGEDKLGTKDEMRGSEGGKEGRERVITFSKS